MANTAKAVASEGFPSIRGENRFIQTTASASWPTRYSAIPFANTNQR